MTASRQWQRNYDESDVRELIQRVGDANSWDDLLRFLGDNAAMETGMSRAQASTLAFDLESLQQQGKPFTDDYREIWRQLTGEWPEENVDQDARDEYPENAASVDARGGSPSSSSRVLDLLHRLESREYQEMARNLERFGDRGWKND